LKDVRVLCVDSAAAENCRLYQNCSSFRQVSGSVLRDCPVFRQPFRLVQHRESCLLLFVGRVAIFAEYPLHKNSEVRPSIRTYSPAGWLCFCEPCPPDPGQLSSEWRHRGL
jgi:hypothetical protein